MSETTENKTPEDHLRAWQESGDRDALDSLLRIEVEILKRMIRGRVGGLHQQSQGVSDVAQEAVLGLLRVGTAPSFDSPGALRGYLWKAAWRLLMRRLSGGRKKPVQLDGQSSICFQEALATSGGMGAAESSDRPLALQLAMNLLKPQEGEILRLVYLENQDISAAARALGITNDAANMRLVRARKALARKVAGWAELIG